MGDDDKGQSETTTSKKSENELNGTTKSDDKTIAGDERAAKKGGSKKENGTLQVGSIKEECSISDSEENPDDKEGSDAEADGEHKKNSCEPLATTRSRRANAGNRMGHLILEEEDDVYKDLYGGFDDEEDDDDFVSEVEPGGDRSDDDNDEDDDDDDESDEDDDVDNELEDSGEDKDETVDAKPSTSKSRPPSKSRPSRSKKQNAAKSIAGFIKEEEQPEIKYQFKDYARICSVCLSAQSDEDDEIIECDSCGVTVHESCYGVTGEDSLNQHDDISVESNISSESTEPWFCEPCKRSVHKPYCELCPNLGGVFKETDTGRWVHMVCALYTRGVTFENIHNLTDVSLFELNYSLYGSKTCTICDDQRLARSGICIDCDAGLCKTFFHATCAQKEGLLFESHSDEVDPYFAQCKQHADKTIIKAKKRTYTALFARLNRAPPIDERPERIREKLSELTKQPHSRVTKWTSDNLPPIPKKTTRMLLTSPSLIIKLTRKSELMGLDPTSSFMLLKDETEAARQKWHIPPAFSLEFVAYCLDRSSRLIEMKKKNSELISQNNVLKREETELREKYNSIKQVVANVRSDNESIIREARAIQKLISNGTGKQFSLPLALEQLIARSSNAKQTSLPQAPKHSAAPPSATHECSKCRATKDQHLLSLCDTCKLYFHIYCLDPPLARVPKKTKFGGWQCSDCSERDEEEQEEALEEQNNLAIQEAEGPRKLRERIKYPEKYCHESMMAANFWSASSRRKSKKSSKSRSKKPKLETS